MIWDLIEDSGFDQHFSSGELCITSLLLDENIISQVKNENPRLLQYLGDNKHQLMRQLIFYSLTMPQPTDSYDRCHRLPYISSELLALDSDLIHQQFFQEGQQPIQNTYWQLLLAFLDSPQANDSLLLGYFRKIFRNLHSANPLKTTTAVASRLQSFIQLLPNGSVADILASSIVLLNVPEGAVYAQRSQILLKVVELFAEGSEQLRAASATILAEIVNKFQTFSSGDQLLQQLLLQPSLIKAYHLEHSQAMNSFIEALLAKCKETTVDHNDQTVPLLQLPPTHRACIQLYLKGQAQRLQSLAASKGLLLNQNQTTVRKSNPQIYPLLRLMALAVEEGLSEFLHQGLLGLLWNLAVLYPYNNILHVLIRKIMLATVGSPSFAAAFIPGVLQTNGNHFTMLRPLVYSVWKHARHLHLPASSQLQQYNSFVTAHLQPLLKYEVNLVHPHRPSLHRKLIVDQQDTTQPKPAQTPPQKSPELPSSPKQTDNQQQQTTNPVVTSGLDFFDTWESGTVQEGSSSKKELGANDMFATDNDMLAKDKDMLAKDKDMFAPDKDMFAKDKDMLVKDKDMFADFCSFL